MSYLNGVYHVVGVELLLLISECNCFLTKQKQTGKNCRVILIYFAHGMVNETASGVFSLTHSLTFSSNFSQGSEGPNKIGYLNIFMWYGQ